MREKNDRVAGSVAALARCWGLTKRSLMLPKERPPSPKLIGNQHGGRDDIAAGGDGGASMRCGKGLTPPSRRRYSSIGCRAAPATFCRRAMGVGCWRLPTNWTA